MSDRVNARLFALAAALTLLFVSTLLAVPYVIRSPGAVHDTLGSVDGQPLIEITGAPTYPTTGQLDLTTVSESSPDSPPQLGRAVAGLFSDQMAVVPEALVYPPGISPQEVIDQGYAQMRESQDAAAQVALEAAGFETTPALAVDSVDPDGPSAGALEVDDRLISIDGKRVTTLDSLRAILDKKKPGQTVTVVVDRAGSRESEKVTLAADPDDPKAARLGIGLRESYVSDVQVEIGLSEVGGPSAGLMFSLGIYDKLTEGSLTGGLHLAGTGTMATDSGVGPIGGIPYKLDAAKDAGAVAFLVPKDNCEEALGSAPDGLRLVKATTFDDARASVEKLATDGVDVAGLPAC